MDKKKLLRIVFARKRQKLCCILPVHKGIQALAFKKG